MKRSRFLLSFVCLMMFALSMLSLTACSENESPHTHVYDKQIVNDTFKASDATCEEKTEYYFSCSCGEKGTETFEYGSALGHAYGEWISIGNGQHKKTCANDNSHTITESCSGGTATCTEKAICDDCGIEYGAPLSEGWARPLLARLSSSRLALPPWQACHLPWASWPSTILSAP